MIDMSLLMRVCDPAGNVPEFGGECFIFTRTAPREGQ